jgi:hypothetical protein
MTTESQQPGLLGLIAAKRRETSIGLIAAAVLFAVLTVWWFSWGWKGRQALDKPPSATPEAKVDDPFADPKDKDKDKEEAPAGKVHSPDYLPFAVWAFLLMALAGGAAAWLWTQPLPPGAELDTVRAEALTVGAVAGLVTTLLGFLLGVRWQDSLFKWVNDGNTKEARWVLIAASIFTLGLVVMFLSLQLGRTQERAKAVLRRMLYGFNAVFLGLLLLMVLVAVNVVSFLKVPTTLLTTDRAFTELAPASKDFLHKLDKPVHVYVILPEKYTEPIQTRHGMVPYERLYTDVHVLLDQCEEESPHIRTTYLSPALDTARIAAVRDRLGVKIDDPNAELVGLIVAVGETEQPNTFIPVSDLIDTVPVGRQAVVISFQAENRLLTEIAYLADARENEVIYFTQDNGELTLDGAGARSMSAVAQVLRDRRMKVQPLTIDEKKPEVPANAAAVVVAGPQTPFAPEGPTMKALRAYLKPTDPKAKPGKLLAYLPAIRGGRNEVIPTGLEGLIGEYGVQVAADRRIVTVPESIPLGRGRSGLVFVPPDSAYAMAFSELRIPIADTLRAGRLLMKDCRPVQPAPPGPGPFRTHGLFGTVSRQPTWQEKDWNTAAATVVRQFEEAPDEDTLRRLMSEKQLSRSSVPVAVAATEASNEPGGKERPRAIVYGSDSPLADRQDFDLQNAEFRALLLASQLDWLREKEVNLGIPPRKEYSFQLGKGPDLTGLLILLAVMIVGLSGLGLGVWLSRRR